MIKIFIKGRQKCDDYENHPLISENFKRIDKNTGSLLQTGTSAARFICVEGGIK